MGYLTAVVALAALTYRWIEVPCRAWFNEKSRLLEAGTPPSAKSKLKMGRD